MNGNAPASGDKAHNFISRYGGTAFGETNGYIGNTLYDDTALGASFGGLLLGIFRNGSQYFFVGQLLLVIPLVVLLHLIDNLAFL